MASTDPLNLFDRLMAVKPAGLSAHAWTVRAGVNRNVFTDIKKNDAAAPATMQKLLAAIDLTSDEFEGGLRSESREPVSSQERAFKEAFRGADRPRDIPVLGTAECADFDFTEGEQHSAIETMGLHVDEVIDYARRPASLDNRRDVYALYFRGHSMVPRYEPGEIAYVDPKRPPRPRDYVIVQLRQPDGDGGERIYVAMAKRLVKVSATFIELEQFNPPISFRVARADVMHIHRIIPWDELVAF